MLKKENLFPTIIYSKDIKINNSLLEEHIINWSKKDIGIHKTNVNGWHSSTNMYEKPEYQTLVKELFDMMFEIFKDENIDRRPVLGDMWANINYLESYNLPHIHSNALYSGVYYVKTTKDCGNLIFDDPRPGTHIIKPTKTKEISSQIKVEPKEGRILIFPSWLWHAVEPNISNSNRISVSFNFIQETLKPIEKGYNG
jgi:uncharacterized protein (TIGR02466 family)